MIDRNSDLWKHVWTWPKVELHRHLEGSVRLSTLIEAAHEHDIPLPAYHLEALRPYVQMTTADANTSDAFLSKFDVLRQFYRSLDIVRRIAREAVEDAAADNITYMELRFTPYALARQNSCSYSEVIEAVTEEIAQAQVEQGICVRLIVSVNRHESLKIATEVIEAALARNDSYVVALDLAGREVGFPAHPFQALFEQSQEAGLHLTVHAGEWEGAENVRHAVEEMGAERIGHGVRAIEDPQVIRLVRDRGVALEVCPTSNVHTGVVQRLEHHPLADLIGLGVRTTVNTDDPSLSNITLTDELVQAHLILGLPLDTLKQQVINAAEAAFLPDDERAVLAAELRTALGLNDTA